MIPALVGAAVVALLVVSGSPADARTGPAEAARRLCGGSTRTTGSLADPALVETTGLAWSRAHPGVLWAHNDSGDTARIVAVGTDGTALGTVTVTGASATDWEDVALGPGPGGADHLFLGDTGGAGTTAGRAAVTVYRIAEPPPPGPGAVAASERAAALTLRYPDGTHDAEALLVDARSGDLVVVTKTPETPGTVYRAPGAATSPAGSTIPLEAVGPVGQPATPGAGRLALELAGLGDKADLVTGADASAAGDVAAVRTYGGIAVFRWPSRLTLAAALTGAPCAAPAPLDPRAPQGEALALAPNGRRLITVSEGVGAPLVELRGG